MLRAEYGLTGFWKYDEETGVWNYEELYSDWRELYNKEKNDLY
jgi:hypothetical protein